MNAELNQRPDVLEQRYRKIGAEVLSFSLASLLLLFAGQGCGQRSEPSTVSTRDPSPPKPSRETVERSDSAPSQSATNIESPHSIPRYELKMAPKALAALEQSAFSNDTYPATFIANGAVYEKVRVRFRGQWARTWPKKPMKIFFEHDHLFEGQHCLDLNSGWRDPAFIREPLAYYVYATCGVPASKSRVVRLDVNGRFRGLYIEVEQPDKIFLSQRKLKGASLYKAISTANEADERDLGGAEVFGRHYGKETQKTEGSTELQSFCHDLARARNVAEFFKERVDLTEYVNYLVAMTLVQHWDCFNKNHFLAFDGRNSKKWSVIPWDLDRTFGDHWHGGFNEAHLPILLGTQQMPGVTGWNRMETKFFSDASLRALFSARLRELLETEFTTEKLFPILDRWEAEIAEDVALDRQHWPGPTPDLHRGIAQVKSYIKRRRAYLLEEVQRVAGADASGRN